MIMLRMRWFDSKPEMLRKRVRERESAQGNDTMQRNMKETVMWIMWRCRTWSRQEREMEREK